ncbi:polysaccharide deacetylase family protein [Coraliomargarita sp. W4R53]
MKWWLILQVSVLKILGLLIVFETDLLLLGGGIFFSGGGLVLAHIFLPRAQGLCDVVSGFRPINKEVWLTIDDGPDPVDTPAILELLATHEATATFFMIGQQAKQSPDLVDQVLAGGHSIGTHTHTHPLKSYWAAGRSRVRHELDRSLSVLNRKGVAVRLYRSPVGIKNFFLRRALSVRGLHCIAWTIRSGDALSQSAETVITKVERELRPGAIILMHEGAQMDAAVRVEALRGVLEMLRAKGYRCIVPSADRWRCGLRQSQCPRD